MQGALYDDTRCSDQTYPFPSTAPSLRRRKGDRIAIAPTKNEAYGNGEAFIISDIDEKGAILLDKAAVEDHQATFRAPPQGSYPALMAAEVVNLSRNILVTGDDFEHVGCRWDLNEAVMGEGTSTDGCMCSDSYGAAPYRRQCTVGLHTVGMYGGTVSIQNTRFERCGQRGMLFFNLCML